MMDEDAEYLLNKIGNYYGENSEKVNGIGRKPTIATIATKRVIAAIAIGLILIGAAHEIIVENTILLAILSVILNLIPLLIPGINWIEQTGARAQNTYFQQSYLKELQCIRDQMKHMKTCMDRCTCRSQHRRSLKDGREQIKTKTKQAKEQAKTRKKGGRVRKRVINILDQIAQEQSSSEDDCSRAVGTLFQEVASDRGLRGRARRNSKIEEVKGIKSTVARGSKRGPSRADQVAADIVNAVTDDPKPTCQRKNSNKLLVQCTSSPGLAAVGLAKHEDLQAEKANNRSAVGLAQHEEAGEDKQSIKTSMPQIKQAAKGMGKHKTQPHRDRKCVAAFDKRKQTVKKKKVAKKPSLSDADTGERNKSGLF
eukprot:256040_1